MAKLLFLPVSIGTGLLAGLLSKKTFEFVWAKIDDRQPPKPEHREADPRKLVLALAVEGAVFRAVKGLVDHGARQGFAKLTGAWPGDERAQAKDA